MRWKQGFLNGLSVSILLAAVACKDNPQQTKLTYMPDMADAPAVKPQLSYLDPPDGAVARTAMIYPPDDQPEEWEKLLHNPYVGHSNEKELARDGKFLFHINCSPCHGADAKGKGSLIDKFPPAPDITHEMYLDRPDGFFFHKITVGGPIMPSRGEHTYPHERWKIILHLRELQKQNKTEGSEQ